VLVRPSVYLQPEVNADMNHMKKAFTLIELLVVIAIIAILAAILFPVFAQAKDAAKASASLSNLKQFGIAANLYPVDYDDVLPLMVTMESATQPWPTTFHDTMQPYMKNRDVAVDPLGPVPAIAGPNGVFQRSQFYGAAPRAVAVDFGNTNDFFVTGTGWTPIVGATPVRYDGVMGVAFDPSITSAPLYGWFRYNASGVPGRSVPSLSTTQMENISDQVLLGPGGNWDLWFGNGKVSGGTATWCNSGYGADPRALNPGSVNISGLHARKAAQAGTGSYRGACGYPNGQSMFVAADSSAKTMNLRRVYEIRTDTAGQRYFFRFWARGIQ
jgi:prepilin-type N-terminal cleavage/methylation domain-containing protein